MAGFDLYRKMAETDGVYAGDWPVRRRLLQWAADEAADFGLPRLLAAQQARVKETATMPPFR